MRQVGLGKIANQNSFSEIAGREPDLLPEIRMFFNPVRPGKVPSFLTPASISLIGARLAHGFRISWGQAYSVCQHEDR
jgi:hypothetical protein